MSPLNDDKQCFVCGQENPDGLHLTFQFDADQAHCDITIPSRFQGWKNIIHGGIVSTLLDEVMVKAAHYAGMTAVTAELTVQYKRPTPAETPLQLCGWIVESRSRILICHGSLSLMDGTLLASAKAKLFVKEGQP